MAGVGARGPVAGVSAHRNSDLLGPSFLTRAEKGAVAAALIHAAGNLVENWDETFTAVGQEPPVDADLAAHQIALWLSRLPGMAWDTRLPG